MDGLVAFRTIVTLKNSERYIFLAEIGQTTYLARIFDENVSKQFINRRSDLERQADSGSHRALEQMKSPLYCFVVLETHDFKGCIASMYNPSMDSNKFEPVYNWGKVLQIDADALKQLILENESVPEELKDYMRSLT